MREMTTMPAPEFNRRRARGRLDRVYRRLADHYGRPRWTRSGTALDCLILTVLSQNTNDRNSLAGFRKLKEQFDDWADIEKAPWRSVASAIRVSGLGNIKSRRIKQILKRVREDQGDHSLEKLKRWEPERAIEYLRDFPGIGPKTAACVLMFSFGKPVFPVDTHILRVSKRLELIPPKTSAEEAHHMLQSVTPDDRVYPLHLLLIRHGREVCIARNPRCRECVLLPTCPTGRERTRNAQPNGPASPENDRAWSMWDELQQNRP